MLTARTAAVAAGVVALAATAVTVPAAHATPAATTASVAATTRPAATRTDPAAAARAALAHPRITWQRCSHAYHCGTLTVPLDYGNLALGTIDLPITRRPADDPKHRIGAIFTNPGGPAAPSTQAVGQFAEGLGATVRKRFDVIGLAPRGVEGEHQAVCVGDKGSVELDLSVPFPMTSAELAERRTYDTAFTRTCGLHPDPVLAHMATADVARDMDLARRALGEKRINYYGISYGTYLGATYAALYPKNIRTLIVDGVLDPVAWATGRGGTGRTVPVTERVGSHVGSQEALMAAFTECERAPRSACPEKGTVRADWQAILARLAKGPVTTPDGARVRYQDVISQVQSVLYSGDDIPALTSSLHELRLAVAPAPSRPRAGSAAPLRRLARKAESDPNPAAPLPVQRPAAGGSARGYSVAGSDDSEMTPIYMGAFQGVLCTDSVNPTDPAAWEASARRADAVAPGFGRQWAWGSSACATWPAKDAAVYRGPFDRPTSAPVLVIGNEHDPATPYAGAVAYHRMLRTSRLLTVKDGYGHGSLGTSACVDARRTSYLLTGTLPAKDMVCRPDHVLYTPMG